MCGQSFACLAGYPIFAFSLCVHVSISRTEVWVPTADGVDLCRPFLKQLRRDDGSGSATMVAADVLGSHGVPIFVVRAQLAHSDRLTDAECFDFLTEKAAGTQACLVVPPMVFETVSHCGIFSFSRCLEFRCLMAVFQYFVSRHCLALSRSLSFFLFPLSVTITLDCALTGWFPSQMLLTNMAIDDEFAVFLLPCRMKHPNGSGQLLGGRSGRRGGFVRSRLAHDVSDGDSDSDSSVGYAFDFDVHDLRLCTSYGLALRFW